MAPSFAVALETRTHTIFALTKLHQDGPRMRLTPSSDRELHADPINKPASTPKQRLGYAPVSPGTAPRAGVRRR